MSSNPLKIAYGSPQLPLKVGDFKVACFILTDMKHVFPISSVQKLLGYEGKSETWILNILDNISKLSKIPKDLLIAYESPIKVDVSTSKGLVETTKMIDSAVFIRTCETFVEAKNNGLLGINLIKISKIAEQILKHTNLLLIDEMITVATGYVTFKDHVKLLLQKYMQEQLNDNVPVWINTLPDYFYDSLFKIHNEDWKTTKANPEIMGKMLYDVIFSRISNKLLKELNEIKPKRTYKRKNNQAQNNEHPQLKQYLEDMMSLLETSGHNWFIFLQLLNRTFPIQNNYDSRLRFEKTAPKKELLSAFNSNLKKLT